MTMTQEQLKAQFDAMRGSINALEQSVTDALFPPPLPVVTLPTMDYAVSPLSGTVPLTVSAIYSGAGAIEVSWDWGDGTHSEGIAATHDYTQAGEYMVTIRAANSAGFVTGSFLVSVTAIVLPPPDPLPVGDPILLFEETWTEPLVLEKEALTEADKAAKVGQVLKAVGRKIDFMVWNTFDRLDPVKDPCLRPGGGGCQYKILPGGILETVFSDGGIVWYDDPLIEGVKNVFTGGTNYSTGGICLAEDTPIDLSNRKCLLLDAFWDPCNSTRRWQDFAVLPVGDHIVRNDWRDNRNTPSASRNALMVSCGMGKWRVMQFDETGPAGVKGPDGVLKDDRKLGGSPTAFPGSYYRLSALDENMASVNYKTDARFNGFVTDYEAHNLHHIQILITSTRVRIYEQGYAMLDWPLLKPLQWNPVQGMLLQQLYHSNLSYQDAKKSLVYAGPWADLRKDATVDVRHWGPIRMWLLPSMPPLTSEDILRLSGGVVAPTVPH